jgi:hypothetical protein
VSRKEAENEGPMWSKYSQRGQCILSDCTEQWFIDNGKDWYQVLVLGLGNKFCDDANVVQSTLCICVAHDSVQPVDLAISSGMIEG